MTPDARASWTDADRMRLRGLIVPAGEIIATYWPMRTFVHHNPLHGLESLPFDQAVTEARDRLGGRGYLSNEKFRDFYRSGRIRPRHLEEALEPVVCRMNTVMIGERKLSPVEILRAHLLSGLTAPAADVLPSLVALHPDRTLIEALARHLGGGLPDSPDGSREVLHAEDRTASGDSEGSGSSGRPGGSLTLSAWCDRALDTRLADRINLEMVKWCEAFLDENHASWPMPGRERGFYGAWKFLAGLERSPLGISGSREKIGRLPSSPEEALLDHLAALGIPAGQQQEYLSLHLAALPGWAAFIKWRAAQEDYPFQQDYPADLLQYLAVRLWYEKELVQCTCLERLGIEGTLDALRNHLKTSPSPSRDPQGPAAALQDGWRLAGLARALEIPAISLLSAPPGALRDLLKGIDVLPETDHGPVWLRAFEAGYQEKLLETLRAALSPDRPGEVAPPAVRPQAQAVFCIDVRSGPFRRHLETVGDYETFGFAGFFSVFVRYRELGSHQETDQFPVIMKARNTVREVLRSYQGGLFSRHRSGSRLLHAGHELLHDLKENVVTPYVAVESLGWFYGLPLLGKTLFPKWQSRLTAALRRLFVPAVSTALTVDKLSKNEVSEMLAAEQRSTIRRALTEHYGDRDLNLSLERLEFLRQRALGMTGPDESSPRGSLGSSSLTAGEEESFIGILKGRYRITHGWAFARMERMTRIGFTLNEQVYTVETALRMMGLVKNFARLVLFCGHGSTSENNPFESALDCGACGGNRGKPNARILATMANKPQVREQLAKNGIVLPPDTWFIAGEHDTTTDLVRLFDLEDLPHTHNNDLIRLTDDLRETGLRNARERCARFPEIAGILTPARASREAHRRSADWSQVRPEWGLSSNASFIIGRRDLTRRTDLGGRAFLHSYDYREDAGGRLLEGIMTGPQVVGEWINMEHYFSTVDNAVFGGGSKIYHNVVGRFGIMSGPQSDLRTGLARQTVMDGSTPFHEPMRLLTVIEAPPDRIGQIIGRHKILQNFYDNEWVRLIALDPDDKTFHAYLPKKGWTPILQGDRFSPQEGKSPPDE